MAYTLANFNNIIMNGFNYTLPQDTLNIINKLAHEVGSPNYVKTPIFNKKKEPEIINTNIKKNKSSEIVQNNDWEAIRNFKTTKIEKKDGVNAKIDIIRSHLNKLTDKNYLDIRTKILNIIDELNEEETKIVGVILFEIASTNRFYSKMYADLYSEMIIKYEIMKEGLEENLNKFYNVFDNIEYVDPSVDYDRFCKINKDNEKRKALSSFFLNLMLNEIIAKDKIICIIINLLKIIYTFISEENKKNEVDELTENVLILFKMDICKSNKIVIEGYTIIEIIQKIASSKVKDYKSLTNKTIFKFMDMIEA